MSAGTRKSDNPEAGKKLPRAVKVDPGQMIGIEGLKTLTFHIDAVQAATEQLEHAYFQLLPMNLQILSAAHVASIRRGVPASKVVTLSDRLGYPKAHTLLTLGFPVSTVERKIKQGEKLSSEQSERFLGLELLIDQVKQMVAESGEPKGFDAAKWLGEWLDQPNSALGGEKPSQYLDTVAGQGMVSRLLAQMQSGAYA